jgi:hypothetical protein
LNKYCTLLLHIEARGVLLEIFGEELFEIDETGVNDYNHNICHGGMSRALTA